jgi:2-keto-3-deoxy-L-rhamnonate aldolase RhmA
MGLKQRLAGGEALWGSFLKTPSPILVEVLASAGLDLLCLDAEHAPFDRLAIDHCAMAARAAALPMLVRTPSAAPEHILNALDCGADGVLLPHIRSAEEARAAVAAAHYGRGGRGYAGSSRAAAYALTPIPKHLAASAERTLVIAQIEDVEAVEAVEAIAAVPGLDALFVGRIDLTIALGETDPDSDRGRRGPARAFSGTAGGHPNRHVRAPRRRCGGLARSRRATFLARIRSHFRAGRRQGRSRPSGILERQDLACEQLLQDCFAPLGIVRSSRFSPAPIEGAHALRRADAQQTLGGHAGLDKTCGQLRARPFLEGPLRLIAGEQSQPLTMPVSQGFLLKAEQLSHAEFKRIKAGMRCRCKASWRREALSKTPCSSGRASCTHYGAPACTCAYGSHGAKLSILNLHDETGN